MGLRRAYLDFIHRSVEATIGGLEGKKMLELGNQRISRTQGIKERTGKAYFTKLGVEHTSLDFNGKDGAVPLDLSQVIDRPDWRGHFDIITNSGTTEHVEPFEAQFDCFANLHNWLKTGGIIVHIVPAREELDANGRWKNHCNNYYSREFFEVLARENGYDVILSTVINDLRAVCLCKNEARPFMTDREAFFAHLARRGGGIEYFGVNDAERLRMKNIIRTFARKLGWRLK